MIKNVFPIIIFLFFGCVSKSKHQKIKEELATTIAERDSIYKVAVLHSLDTIVLDYPQIDLFGQYSGRKDTTKEKIWQKIPISAYRELSPLENILNNLNQKSNDDNGKSDPKYYTESEALGYVKDWYDFYNSDVIFRNARIRRTNNNSFMISLEETNKMGTGMDLDGEPTFSWFGKVYILKIREKDYTFELFRN